MREPYPRSAQDATGAAVEGASYYVYGALAAADAERRADVRARDDTRLVARIRDGVGVLGCLVDGRDRAAVRALTLAHEDVVAGLAAHGTILPALPATVATVATLDDWLARTAPLLRELLTCVAGRLEVDVTAQWSLHALVRDASGAMPDGVRAADADAMVAVPRYLARRRKRDADRRAAAAMRAEVSRRVLAALETAAVVVHRAPPAAERLDVACLVRVDRLAELDAVIAEAARALAGVAIARGAPRAPYAFAALRLTPHSHAVQGAGARRTERAS